MKPRKSASKKKLKSAREISIGLSKKQKANPNRSALFTLWGLFIDHDITSTAITKLPDDSSISCCDSSIVHQPESLMHPECFPIHISQNDPFYSKFNVTCMNFVRSAPVKTWHDNYRHQLNQITSYLDGSAVYGSSENEAKSMRSFVNGKLSSSRIDGYPLLPLNKDSNSFCGKPKSGSSYLLITA